VSTLFRFHSLSGLLSEWVQYHLFVGFSHVLFYDRTWRGRVHLVKVTDSLAWGRRSMPMQPFISSFILPVYSSSYSI
jgi:hypothetical protein